MVLVLFGVFTICILAVLFSGAGTYERLVQRQQNGYAERTVPQYIATKVRQADMSGAVSIGEFSGVPALELTEILAKEEYITRIYCYGGYLRELYCAASGSFQPEDGECILETEQVDFSLEDNCLQIVITGADGKITRQVLTLRSTRGGSGE